MNLKGKVAIVTGSTRGIGKAIAIALAEKGSCVVINSKDSEEEGKKLEKQLKEEGFNVKYIQADVSEIDDIGKLFKETTIYFGNIDILVNNAGVYRKSQATFEDYIYFHRTNGFGVFLCCDRAVQYMAGRGKIINISSIFGKEASPCSIIASGVKAEVDAYTKAFAKKYKGRIEVNEVAPGYTDTLLLRRNFSPEDIDKVSSNMSHLRIIKPEEIAQGVIALMENDQITGQTLIIDGGLLL